MLVVEVFGVVIISLIVVYCVAKLKKIICAVKKINEFPGKKCNPLLGNLLDILGTPETTFQKIRDYAGEFCTSGICRIWLTVIPIVAIFGPEDMERVLANPANNKKPFFYDTLRPWLGDGLLTSGGTKWHSRRKMLTPTFHFNILQKFLQTFQNESKHLVKKIEKNLNEEVDITEMITEFTLNSICETAMGISLNKNVEEGEKYRNAVHYFGQILFNRAIHPWLLLDWLYYFTGIYAKEQKAVEILHNFSTGVIRQRKKDFKQASEIKNGDSLFSTEKKRLAMLDLLVTAQNNGVNISDEGVREEVDTFIFEGHDTTSVSICFTLMLLANNRHCQEKIYEEIVSVQGSEERTLSYKDFQELKYMERCIKESLRLYPSVPIIARTVGEDVTTQHGWIIPKGCTILGLIYDIHRRDDLYPDPEKFDPDRFLLENVVGRHPFAYIPFSAGPRNCIGQKFAMMEIKCVLTEILKKYILLPIDTPQSLPAFVDLVLRTRNPIRMKFVPRN